MKKMLLLIIFAAGIGIKLYAQTYVGSNSCMPCHNNVHATKGYNIWQEYTKTGHPYKLQRIQNNPPVYPANTSPGVPNPPANTSWSDFQYVIGGYGWKARFVRPNGFVHTMDSTAQYNLANQKWVPYNLGIATKYNFSCFKCHTTGASPAGSWNGVAADSLGTFNEPGVRCEGCHGPSSLHVLNPFDVSPPITGTDLTFERCGDCHQRNGKNNTILIRSNKYIDHREQYNELLATKHRLGSNPLTCGSCHDALIALLYKDAAGTHATTGQKLRY
jgi:hypothetical protein